MESVVDKMIAKDYQNELLDVYERETGKEPVPPEGGHTQDFERWFVERCEEAESRGYLGAKSALEYIKGHPGNRYYIAIEEWLYPTESGREFIDDFDTFEDAVKCAKELCESETYNFSHATGCDPLPPAVVELKPDGKSIRYVITPKNGLDDWWYSVKVVEMRHGEGVD